MEGVVWLGLEERLSESLLEAAIGAYLVFAQVVLPVLVPIGLLLFEREPIRRRRLFPFVVIGSAVSARLLWVITTHPIGARALDHSIVYDTDAHFGYVVAAGYVVATCGPALLSSSSLVSMFGVANLVGLGIASVIRYSAVTSVWCFYAALASGFVAIAVFRRAAERGIVRLPQH